MRQEIPDKLRLGGNRSSNRSRIRHGVDASRWSRDMTITVRDMRLTQRNTVLIDTK